MSTVTNVLDIITPILQLGIIITAIYSVRITLRMGKLNKKLWKLNDELNEEIHRLHTARFGRQLDAFSYTPVKKTDND